MTRWNSLAAVAAFLIVLSGCSRGRPVLCPYCDEMRGHEPLRTYVVRRPFDAKPDTIRADELDDGRVRFVLRSHARGIVATVGVGADGVVVKELR